MGDASRAPAGSAEVPAAVLLGAVDDHVPIRHGLRMMLAGDPTVRVVGTADTVEHLLDGAGTLDVVLLDLHLADGSQPSNNVATLMGAGVDVLVYSSLTDPALLREALVAGALGVVHKSQEIPELLAAVHAAALGEPLLTTEWAATLDGVHGPSRPQLSDREGQALRLYASGLPMKSAARRMDISLGSFREYLMRVRRKYTEVDRPASTKLELYRRAVEDGYVSGSAGTSG